MGKVISWAFVSATIIGTTTYVETSSLRAAAITALVAASLKTPIYSLHEIIWNRIRRRQQVKIRKAA